jgi:phage host-nuclease inhibitor protein Gam
MTTARLKKKTAESLIETQQDFERLIGEITEGTIVQRQLQNAMDEELAAVRAKYERELPGLEREIGEKLSLAQEYCDAHRDLFPKDRKSIEVLHAVVGYRTGTPKLKLARGWTWDRTLEKLQANRVMRWIRTKAEVNKDAILTDRDATPAVLEVYGVRIVQDETFYVEPKLEAQPARVTEVRP